MGICVIRSPIGPTANATRSLLDILSTITAVSLVTASVNPESDIQKKYEVIEISEADTGKSIIVSVFRFVLNQIRMCNAIRNRNEDVIWFFGTTSYLVPVLFSKLLGRTVVIQPRGDVPLTLEIYWSKSFPSPIAHVLANSVRLLERISYQLSDGIVTYTPAMAAQLGLEKYDEKLYPKGARYVRTDIFYSRTLYEDRENVVGFLGRLDEEKRVRELAEVAKRLSDDVTFVFAGDGNLKAWLEEELSDEIASGNVEMTGWVEHDEVPEVLSRFKILVLPSQPTEGLPTVILESFACGTPVYATPVSGVPDVVVEGETGFIMDETEPEEILQKVSQGLNDEALPVMSERCQVLIEEKYDFEAAVERYKTIHQAILG